LWELSLSYKGIFPERYRSSIRKWILLPIMPPPASKPRKLKQRRRREKREASRDQAPLLEVQLHTEPRKQAAFLHEMPMGSRNQELIEIIKVDSICPAI